MSILKEYSELIALAKTCLQEESSTWLPSDLESYKYFKSYAVQKKVSKEPRFNQTAKKQEQTSLPEVTDKKELDTLPIAQIKKIDSSIPFKKTPLNEEQIKQTNNNHLFELTPLKSVLMHDLLDVKKIVQSLWPNLPLLDKPSTNEPDILILFKDVEKKEMVFLSNLAKALQIIGTAKLLPLSKFQKNHYQKLKMVVLTKSTSIIKEEPVRYFEISHIADYLQNPKLKRNLWKALKDACLS